MIDQSIDQLNQTNYQMRQNISKVGIIVNQLSLLQSQNPINCNESDGDQVVSCIDAINTLLNDVHYQVLKNDDGLIQISQNWHIVKNGTSLLQNHQSITIELQKLTKLHQNLQENLYN